MKYPVFLQCDLHRNRIISKEEKKQLKKYDDMKAKNLTKAEFVKNVVDFENHPNEWNFLGERPALIDFYASWCGPCKKMSPIIDELAADYDGKLDVYKVNVEDEEELASLFGIRSIPSLLFIPMNGQPQMAQGALPKATLNEVIQSIL